ncbi:MAG: PCMD domain-containing protein [Bacteroidaceae bacterium]|nr:PCMD domain-containing protein [Bacteroidaceae bacterium]
MKKSVLFLMSAALLLGSNVMADDQPQVPNGDFESWTFDGVNLPDNWNSFQTATGGLAGMGYDSNNRQVKQSTDVRPGSNGQYSCVIWARQVKVLFVTAKAQGNLTSGRINAGNASATHKNNFNYTDRTGATSANGKVGVPCAMPFTGKPKEVKVWVKFKPGKDISTYGNHKTAKFSAIIHSDADYISYGLASNDTPENKALVVASAVKEIEYNGGTWEQLTIPFEYTDNGALPAYIQINASTNAYPGAGEVGDSLWIDDIEMVYEPVSNVKIFDKDELYVTVNGDETGPYNATVYVTENDDNTINFQLKNFVLEVDDQKLGIGNINVNSIPVSVADGITSFADDQSILIEEGDDPTVDTWMGPYLGEIPLDMSGKYDDDHLYVTIDIDMRESIGDVIHVTLGKEGDVTTVTSLKTTKKAGASGIIYDINGRPVSEMQPGRYYIVDGKIVMN